jgi:hypothetical protein
MNKYKLTGGGIIQASTPDEFLKELNEKSIFGFQHNQKLFMTDTAIRCFQTNSVHIRTNNAAEFLEDLIKHRFVEVID